MENETITHESFGQLSFSRVRCTPPAKFYGSELPQDHYIVMELNNSEIVRQLSYDRYYPTNTPTILKLRLSSGQFSDLITSLNTGNGVCCTIEYLNGKKVEDMPNPESRKEFVQRKFEEKMKEFAKTIRDNKTKAANLIKKKTLSKADMHELQMHINHMTNEIEQNIPYFSRAFQETMDEVVFDAKLEVENAIQHKLTVLGLNALKAENEGRMLLDRPEPMM